MGDDGPIHTGEGGFHLQTGQKLVSTAGGIELKSSLTEGRTALWSPDGLQGTLYNDPSTDIVLLGDDTVVSGIIFDLGGTAIAGYDVLGKIRVADNVITNSAGSGIFVSGYGESTGDGTDYALTSVLISGNTIQQTQGPAIWVENYSTMPMTTERGLPVTEPGTFTLTIADNHIGRSADFGIRVSADTVDSEVTVSGNTIEASAGDAILVNAYSWDSLDLAMSGNTIGSGYNGITAWVTSDGTGSISITDNDVAHASNDGIQIYSDFGDIEISNNTIGAAQYGYGLDVSVLGNETSMTLAGNEIDYAYYDGIYVYHEGYSDQSLAVENNTIGATENGSGIFAEIHAPKASLSVIGNTVDYAYYTGIEVYADANGLEDEETGNLDMVVSGNTIELAEEHGIFINPHAAGNLNLSIADNTVEAVDDYGIYLYDDGYYYYAGGDANIVITGNTLGFAYEDSIYVNLGANGDLSLTVDNNILGNSYYDGIDVQTYAYGSSLVTVSGNQVDYVDDDAILVEADASGSSVVVVSGNTIDSTEGVAIDVDVEAGENSSIAVSGNSVGYSEDELVYVYTDAGLESTVIVTSNSVETVADEEVVEVDSYAGTVSSVVVTGNSAGYGYDGIYVESNGAESVVTVTENSIDYIYDGNAIYIGSDADWSGESDVAMGNSVVTVADNAFEYSYYGVDIYSESSHNSIVNVTNNDLGDVPFDHGIDVDADAVLDSVVVVSGNTVEFTEDSGVYVDSNAAETSTVTVSNNTLESCLRNGVYVDSGGSEENNVSVLNNTLERTGERAVYVYSQVGGLGDVEVSGNAIGFSSLDGIYVYASNDNDEVTVSDNVIERASQDAIVLEINSYDSVLSVSGNTIGYAGYNGIDVYTFSEGSTDVSVSANSIETAGNEGIYVNALADENVAVSITDNIVERAASEELETGISVYLMAGVDGMVTVSGNLVEYAEGAGIAVESGAGNRSVIDVSANSVGYASGDGIDVMSSASLGSSITVSGNTVHSASGNGITVLWSDGSTMSLLARNIETAVNTVLVADNTIGTVGSVGFAGFAIAGEETELTISGNSFQNALEGHVAVVSYIGDVDAAVSNNQMGSTSGFNVGLGSYADEDDEGIWMPASIDATVTDNSFASGTGIYLEANDGNGEVSGSVNAEVSDNTIGEQVDPWIVFTETGSITITGNQPPSDI